jgi:hypothetical protein
VTLRVGVERGRTAHAGLAEAEAALAAATQRARLSAQRQRVPFRVELRDGGQLLAVADLAADAGARG